jgi:hypothetical protein
MSKISALFLLVFASLLLVVLVSFSARAGEEARPVAAPAPSKYGAIIPAMATVASVPALYAAHDENWISLTIKAEDGWRVINAKARSLPDLMLVRPGDNLNLVLQKDGSQEWVLSFSIVGPDGIPVGVLVEEADVVTEVDRTDRNVAVAKTRRGQAYKIDRRLSSYELYDGAFLRPHDWSSRVRVGEIVRFEYVQRADARWAVAARTGSGRHYNPHADPQVVTKIVSARYSEDGRRMNHYWYYVWTQFPKIKYEVDSRQHVDVRLQRVGDPPMWHKDREPSPFSEVATLSAPSRVPPLGVNVLVQGDTTNVSSINSVTGINTSTNVNSNANSNQNANTNTNSNSNWNANNNQNSNSNANNNQNTNTNANQNQNSNSNQNSTDVNNSNGNSNNLSNQNTSGARPRHGR